MVASIPKANRVPALPLMALEAKAACKTSLHHYIVSYILFPALSTVPLPAGPDLIGLVWHGFLVRMIIQPFFGQLLGSKLVKKFAK